MLTQRISIPKIAAVLMNLLDVNFWFHCYLDATSLTWCQNRLTWIDRWRWGCLQMPLSEKGFDLFAFVEDPHYWNENTDDIQPLCGGENNSSGVGVFIWVSHQRLCLRLFIFDYDSSFSCSFFLHPQTSLVLSMTALPEATCFGFLPVEWLEFLKPPVNSSLPQVACPTLCVFN